MRKKPTKEYWVRNVTESDLIISDLDLKVLAGRVVNLYQLNPRLRPANILESEEEGAVGKCLALRKLLKLPSAPTIVDQDLPTEIKEATTKLQSRTKSAGVANIKELDLIEEISEMSIEDSIAYEEMDSGVHDPMVEAVPMNSDGSELGVVVNPAPDDVILEVPHADEVGAEPQQVGSGSSRYFTVQTFDKK